MGNLGLLGLMSGCYTSRTTCKVKCLFTKTMQQTGVAVNQQLNSSWNTDSIHSSDTMRGRVGLLSVVQCGNYETGSL